MIIYKAINLINKKVYIGQTINTLEYRKSQHNREVNSSKKKNSYFHNAINKYGFDNFIFEIIEEVLTLEQLNIQEIYWINYYCSTDKDIGYNLDSGGSNCTKSESTKKKIGESTKERWKNQETAGKMLNGLRKGSNNFSEKCYKNRVTFICAECGKKTLVPKYITSKRKYCSSKCFGKNVPSIGLIKANQTVIINNINKKRIIAKFILEWCVGNKEIVLNCSNNKITTSLKDLLKLIEQNFDIKDIRSLFDCFNVKGRKELLTYLKNYIIKENVC